MQWCLTPGLCSQPPEGACPAKPGIVAAVPNPMGRLRRLQPAVRAEPREQGTELAVRSWVDGVLAAVVLRWRDSHTGPGLRPGPVQLASLAARMSES